MVKHSFYKDHDISNNIILLTQKGAQIPKGLANRLENMFTNPRTGEPAIEGKQRTEASIH